MLADTMKRVQEAEQQAAGILEDAKAKAASMAEQARQSAAQTLADARSGANDASKAALADAKRNGEAEKEKFAASLQREIETSKKQAFAKADVAVDAIIAGLV